MQYWESNEEEWETDDEEDAEKDEDQYMEDDDEEDMFQFFLVTNTEEVKKNEFLCKYCIKENNVTFSKKELYKHFTETHRNDFEEFFGPDVSWEDAISYHEESKKSKKKKGKKKGGMNMGMFNMFGGDMNMGMGGGMPFMQFDMGNMGNMANMFGMSQDETEKMMSEFENMMGGMMGDGVPSGGKKKKKGKK